MQPTSILDASALLAYLQGEPGAAVVANALTQGSLISSVNWAETLSKLAERGQDPDTVTDLLTNQGLFNNALMIAPFDADLAQATAKLRPLTRISGLSLGDRACLALGIQTQLPVLTSDQAWSSLTIGVVVQLIR
ncbi:MAG: type II toxin-antitoxin system VapC family toxin [Cyanobacteria bacterium]|nr:type II toxin-antitoxin system VapC family toxin [Cyanobacteriota bacterium]